MKKAMLIGGWSLIAGCFTLLAITAGEFDTTPGLTVISDAEATSVFGGGHTENIHLVTQSCYRNHSSGCVGQSGLYDDGDPNGTQIGEGENSCGGTCGTYYNREGEAGE